MTRIDATIEGMASTSAITATFCATLVDEWIRCGVAHAVVAPGSRSTPMALAIASRDELTLHIFHDERSASFAALGIGLSSKNSNLMPAILLCTSGTAAVEFHAAVVEASHASVPMLVCTADRPPELQGVGAPQTINQQNLYGVSTRLFVDAGVADDVDQFTWRALAQRLLHGSVGSDPGPVHLNMPFREPLVGQVLELPPAIEVLTSWQRSGDQLLDGDVVGVFAAACAKENGVIVAGSGIDDPRLVLELAHRLQWPVLADGRSGCRVPNDSACGSTIVAFSDIVLRDADTASALKPSIVLRFGEPPVSKVVNTWIRESGCKYLAVSETQQLIDPDRIVAAHLVGMVSQICTRLNTVLDAASLNRSANTWIQGWREVEAIAATTLVNYWHEASELSEPLVARTVVDEMPRRSNLVLSSSMPVRDVEWFGAPKDGLRVLSNRGVNGIDGVVSTAVGVAIESNQMTALLIGDIALLHDTNGLLNLRDRSVDLKIVVVDNGGGGIFSFLPQATTLSPQRFEQLFGTPHKVDIEQLVGAHGLPCTTVSTVGELRRNLAQVGTRVLIVNTDREKNVLDHEAIYAAVAVALRGE